MLSQILFTAKNSDFAKSYFIMSVILVENNVLRLLTTICFQQMLQCIDLSDSVQSALFYMRVRGLIWSDTSTQRPTFTVLGFCSSECLLAL